MFIRLLFLNLLNYGINYHFAVISLLSEKIGKETAEDLTVYIEEKIKDEYDRKSEILATKKDLAELETKLTEKFLLAKADAIKWMFIFWIGQVIATFGFILLFLKK